MKLAIMTKSTFFVEEDKIIATLFEAGLDNLHLYKPGSSPIYSERLLSLLPDTTYDKITVHGHFYLKEEYSLAGIHLDNSSQIPPIGYKGTVSRTCSCLDELKAAKKQSAYVFLNNTFGTEDAPSQTWFSNDELTKAAKSGLIDKKVFALGNVSSENIQTARDLGFGGIVIGCDLWSRFDIHNQSDYKDLIAYFERLRKMVR